MRISFPAIEEWLLTVRAALATWLLQNYPYWVEVQDPCRYGRHVKGRTIRLEYSRDFDPDRKSYNTAYECAKCTAVIYGGIIVYSDERAQYALRTGRQMEKTTL